MNCRKAKTLLALHAGGDLPESQSGELEVHLATCVSCSAELKALQRDMGVLAGMMQHDQPGELPENFAMDVQREVNLRREEGQGFVARVASWRPRLSYGGVAVVILLAMFVAWDAWKRPDTDISVTQDRIAQTDTSAEVRWSDISGQFNSCMEGPYQLSDWKVPSEAGVYAIMHKPDPEGKPDVYVIDYCGESSRMSSYRAYPWFDQWERRMIDRAGSRDNVYIAVCLSDQTSKKDRRSIEQSLIDQYNPFFNTRRGA